MAAPLGTITLNANCVLVGAYTGGYLEPIGVCAIGSIVQVGDDVTAWAVDDVIGYNGIAGGQFKELTSTYKVLPQENIYFKYEAPAAP